VAPLNAVLASQNRNKRAELREGLPGWRLEPLDADEWPAETGETYAENALLKARFGRTRAAPGEWVLGEDSGIEADALDGGPGLTSARWAPGRDQADALLERLAGERNRGARMVTELVAFSPAGEEFGGRGVLEGVLATERRGKEGFGYDPIFVGQDTFGRTLAELDAARKNLRSHRRRVLDELFLWASQNRSVLA